MKLRNKKTGEITSTSGGEPMDLFITDEFNRINHKTYSSLAELNAEWEDYTPKEPLIDDVTLRILIHDWAYINNVKKVLYFEHSSRCYLTCKDNYINIELVGGISTLEDRKTYTITELCGEEEDER